MSERYAKWRQQNPYAFQPELVPFVRKMVGEYDALIAFLHPNAPLIHGIPREIIRRTVEVLGPEAHKNFGVEVHNLMPYVTDSRGRAQEEARTRKFTRELNLTQVSFWDGHTFDLHAALTTEVQMPELTAAAHHEAIVLRGTIVQDVKWTLVLAAKALMNTYRDPSWLVKAK